MWVRRLARTYGCRPRSRPRIGRDHDILVVVLVSGAALIVVRFVRISGLDAQRSQRSRMTPDKVPPKGLPIQTVLWRAPEILFGDLGFSFPADIWSLGCIVAELGGSGFNYVLPRGVRDFSEAHYCNALFLQLGFPEPPLFRELPAWRSLTASRAPRRAAPWGASVARALGKRGVQLLGAMLAWSPSSRPLTADVLSHPFLDARRCQASSPQ